MLRDVELTDGLVRDKRLVIEAEDLRNVVEVGMLDYEGPLSVVQAIVEVCNGYLDAPVLLVVELDMPVHANRAHVVGALQERRIVFLRRVDSAHAQELGVATAIRNSFR